MAKDPYRTARQEHLGDMLDELQQRRLLEWHWAYDTAKKRAIYCIAQPPGQDKRKFDTRRAEGLAANLCQQQGIAWLPVPNPGGEEERDETLRRMRELSNGRSTGTGRTTQASIPPITSSPVDLDDYPKLRHRLRDVPGDDRSAQTFSAARTCIELGLSDGQVKCFLAQYPPFRDKHGTGHGADRELDRVISAARRKDST